jgi:hypothetical protein
VCGGCRGFHGEPGEGPGALKGKDWALGLRFWRGPSLGTSGWSRASGIPRCEGARDCVHLGARTATHRLFQGVCT